MQSTAGLGLRPGLVPVIVTERGSGGRAGLPAAEVGPGGWPVFAPRDLLLAGVGTTAPFQALKL